MLQTTTMLTSSLRKQTNLPREFTCCLLELCCPLHFVLVLRSNWRKSHLKWNLKRKICFDKFKYFQVNLLIKASYVSVLESIACCLLLLLVFEEIDTVDVFLFKFGLCNCGVCKLLLFELLVLELM